MFGLRFRDQLPTAVQDEFEGLIASVQKYLFTNHNDDGTHSDIVADSLDLQGARVGEWVDLPFAATRFFSGSSAVWTVTEAQVEYLKAMRIGQLVTVFFSIQASDLSVDTADQLIIRLPEFHAIPYRKDGSLFQNWNGGSIEWIDSSGSGMGVALAQASPIAGRPSTTIQVTRIGPATATFAPWDIGSVSVSGHVAFPCVPNNTPVDFSF